MLDDTAVVNTEDVLRLSIALWADCSAPLGLSFRGDWELEQARQRGSDPWLGHMQIGRDRSTLEKIP